MQFKQFQPLALVTESRIESVQANRTGLLALLSLSMAVTEVADAYKKNIFYGREVNQEDLKRRLAEIQSMARVIAGTDITADIETIDVEPRLFHAVIGKFTETGEMIEAMEDHIVTGAPLDVVNMREELGDDQWYNAILCDTLGINMDEALEVVINKLRARYGDKFTAYAANHRDLDVERAILEET